MDDEIYSHDTDISSRLDDIENKIDSLDTRYSSSWGGILNWFICAFVIGGIIGIFDLRFSVPKNFPNKIESGVVSESVKQFFIIYNEDFSGNAVYDAMNGSVTFTITSDSKTSYSLKDLKVYLWTKKGADYGLDVIQAVNLSTGSRASYINPNSSVEITAKGEGSPPLEQIKGFSLKTSWNEPRIRFGYEDIGWWNHTRWFLRELIGK